MIEQLCELLRRQAACATELERRLRALELISAAGEHRFVSLALDEVQASSEQLAALELSRSLTLSAAGLDPDVAASALAEQVRDASAREELREAVAVLHEATTQMVDAKARAEAVVRRSAQENQTRLAAAAAFQLA
ncbi:MAG: hypothetical protein JJT89_13815 [Nitriliruptoraceae bacterium]|nr:hypothetical protein [Nitriliruptoraceae bacterium]